MMKNSLPTPTIILATMEDYPAIQKMWPFYIYDMGRYCGFNEGWEDPTGVSFIADNLTHYLTDKTRKAFLVKVGNELAGFVLLNQAGRLPGTQWNMGEFFISAKFQGKGIGKQVAFQIWPAHPGAWEISVIPENISALNFWRKAVAEFTKDQYSEEVISANIRGHEASRYILSFSVV